MKQLLAIALAALLMMPALGAHAAPDTPAKPGLQTLLKRLARGRMGKLKIHDEPRPVADIAFTSPSGTIRHLSEWRGKVVLVSFWASWCLPCRTEMPELDRLQRQLGGKDFDIIPLTFDSDLKTAQAFYDKYRVQSLALYGGDTQAMAKALDVPGLPMTLVLDRKGREVARLRGSANWSAWEAVLLLKAVMRDQS